jgi:lysophospholipase L1-like esterase
MTRQRIAALLLVGALLASLAANWVLYRRGHSFYRQLAEVRLDPLGLGYPGIGPAPSPPAGEVRVVLLGDSRIEDWPRPGGPPGYQFVNRGIGNQTTAQILARFDEHVSPLAPQVVVIQAGINDLKTVPLFPDRREAIVADCQANLARIVGRARDLGAIVVLTTLFPLGEVPLERRLFWSDEVGKAVREVNAFLPSLAGEGVIVLDTVPLLADGEGRVREAYSRDLLHLTAEGYDILNAALEEILASRAQPSFE